MNRPLDLLELLKSDIQLKRVAGTKGGEYAGPCPFCGGTDRFRVWPNHPSGTARWRCMGHKEGRAGCGRGGDAIAYLVERGDITPAEAGRLRHGESWSGASRPRALQKTTPRPPKRQLPPSPQWQQAARAFVAYTQEQLRANAEAQAWLHDRGLNDETIQSAGLGWNPEDKWRAPRNWGFSDRKRIWLPKGWVIPWEIGGDLWQVSIRRPEGQPKYVMVRGSKHALYNADGLKPDRPAILTEGVFDVLSIAQVAGDMVTPVAAGSTTGARGIPWIAKLTMCSRVLVAFDAEVDKGDKAAAWWAKVLPNAKRWRPFWGDANAMAQEGVDVRAWVIAGLEEIPSRPAHDSLESQMKALLQEPDATTPQAQLDWCRRYAKLAGQLGWPCSDSRAWLVWLAKIESDFS
jgi:DNA primase